MRAQLAPGPLPGQDDPAGTYALTVTARTAPAPGVITLDLRTLSGDPLPAWAPGAHLEVVAADRGGRELVRHYSLCGDPADTARYRVAILAVPGGRGGSEHLHRHATVGTSVTVRGPHNHFPFHDAEEYVFVAGGIGITPILAMIREAQRRRKPWRAVYVCRSRQRMAFIGELAEIGAHAPPGALMPWCTSERGPFDLSRFAESIPARARVYACGPETMLTDLELARRRCGSWQLHLERFGSAPISDPAADTGFEVTLARSGVSYRVPADRSILSVLREHDIPGLDWSCAEGVCGTCETAVLEGIPDHRDAVLSPGERAAGDSMMICVSRARSSRLVLDL